MKSINLFHNGKQYRALLDDKGNVIKRTPTIDANDMHETIPPELIQDIGLYIKRPHNTNGSGIKPIQ